MVMDCIYKLTEHFITVDLYTSLLMQIFNQPIIWQQLNA